MKVLLDSCIWGGAAAVLSAASHDVIRVSEWPEDPGDEVILEFALREKRVLITLDKDFGELAIRRRFQHAGIIRLAGFRARQQGVVCAYLLSTYGGELSQGALVTADPERVRVRVERLPDD